MREAADVRAQRRSWRVAWALGSGAAAFVVYLVSSHWVLPGNNSSTVYASGPGLSDVARTWLIVAGCGLAMSAGSYLALLRSSWDARARAWHAIVWGVVGAAAAGGNVYWVLHPIQGWQNPIWIQLIITFPIAGSVGGFASSLVLPPVSAWRSLVMAARWGLACLVGAVLTPYAFYFSAAFVDLSEMAQLGAAAGAVVGSFAMGGVLGWVAAVISPQPVDSRPAG